MLIAYGQTGSGKTFSMLGKPKLGVVGLLPRMLAYMVQRETVTKVELSAVEAFGHHVAKIELFDLYDPDNQTQVWNDKLGNTSLDMMKARRVPIMDADDAHKKIIFAHAASHFAPTGKNPESSRGHVTFVAKITQQMSKHESKISYFVMGVWFGYMYIYVYFVCVFSPETCQTLFFPSLSLFICLSCLTHDASVMFTHA